MNTLKSNLRQEHWESLSWASTCHQLLTPWQMATLLVETHPQWQVSTSSDLNDLHSMAICCMLQGCDDRTPLGHFCPAAVHVIPIIRHAG